ncbi:prepilin-type N-terminal cleavage/methylation domain-containing protein [Halomonas sp. Bachu 37]|uniref:type IV pilus modification PilV family protein n=1 Tax=Halomonas kashgarensis TaxID=3084920 RepID=UPI0032166A37
MRRQRGFSLIEALVALVILSFGLIGVAAMQLKALQSATAGYQHSVATLAAVDAQERLWAQLGLGKECSNIDINNAVTIQGDTDNPGWETYWFGSEAQEAATPLREFMGTIYDENSTNYPSEYPELGPCEFLIEIDMQDGYDPFTYNFRLPNL